MGFLVDRFSVVYALIDERLRFGIPEVTGSMDREVLFLLDGVGGFQAGPMMVRRALRQGGSELGTVLFDWQTWLTCEILTDLCWLRRNQWMGRSLARKLLTFRRAHPKTVVHLLAYSGGAGIAVFACEQLRGRGGLETLVLGCPALSPGYNLGPALRAVKRCYALISARDRLVLGLGTRTFGTTDRCFARAAGLVGFRIPDGVSDGDARAYERLREIHWSPALKEDRHGGGHTGWGSIPFLRRHLPAILRGEPRLPVRKVERA